MQSQRSAVCLGEKKCVCVCVLLSESQIELLQCVSLWRINTERPCAVVRTVSLVLYLVCFLHHFSFQQFV